MTDIPRLDTMPLELLLLIFENCTVSDLEQLSRTCTYFSKIISDDRCWIKKSKKLFVTNQISERFRKRCNPLLSSRDKCIISEHWRHQIKYEKNVHKLNVRRRGICRSHIQMTKEMLWWSCMNIICGYKRTGNSITPSDLICYKNIRSTESGGFNNCSNFQKFVLCNNEIITTHENGAIKKWKMKQERTEDGKKTNCLHLRTTYSDSIPCLVSCVDATSQYIISTYWKCNGDATTGNATGIKMRKNINESKESVCCEYNTREPYMKWLSTLAIDPTGTKLAVGYFEKEFIEIFDINSAHFRLDKISKLKLLNFHPEWPKISNIVWEDCHTFLTCGDIYLAKWDLRTGQSIRSWSISENNHELCCISSDYQYTIMTGASERMIYVWDQRQSDHVTMYDLYSDDLEDASTKSPVEYPHGYIVNSLQFDSSHLYATMNEYLYEYNFAEHVKQKVELSELGKINVSRNTKMILRK